MMMTEDVWSMWKVCERNNWYQVRVLITILLCGNYNNFKSQSHFLIVSEMCTKSVKSIVGCKIKREMKNQREVKKAGLFSILKWFFNGLIVYQFQFKKFATAINKNCLKIIAFWNERVNFLGRRVRPVLACSAPLDCGPKRKNLRLEAKGKVVGHFAVSEKNHTITRFFEVTTTKLSKLAFYCRFFVSTDLFGASWRASAENHFYSDQSSCYRLPSKTRPRSRWR